MLQVAQFITIVYIAYICFEADIGRVISDHSVFNDKLGLVAALSWVIYWVIRLN